MSSPLYHRDPTTDCQLKSTGDGMESGIDFVGDEEGRVDGFDAASTSRPSVVFVTLLRCP